VEKSKSILNMTRGNIRVVEKDGPYLFPPKKKENIDFVMTRGKNEAVEKDSPNLLERFLIL
jgi:hypothetical protein